MICKTGLTPSDLLNRLHDKYGKTCFMECNLKLEKDIDLNDIAIPEFNNTVKKVNRIDGIKTYFEDDSFVICRHSEIEPLIRIFVEAKDEMTANAYIEAWRKHILNR